MWLAFYNAKGIGDVLLLTSGALEPREVVVTRKDKVAALANKATGQIVGYNVFDVADLGLATAGAVELNENQVAQVIAWIQQAGFDVLPTVDATPKFVVGQVESCVPHPDSDHLSITQTRVSAEEVLQIVCGASNIAKGQHVIVAKPGAVMPSGLIIWPGELRGEVSNGMICSTRELGLEQIEDKPGIWVLPATFAAGTPLAEVVATY